MVLSCQPLGSGAPGSTAPAGDPIIVTKGVDYDPRSKNPSNLLDVFSPAGADNAPVVLFVHGGGWKNGSKDQFQYRRLATSLAEAGYVTVLPSYRLSQVAMFPAPIRDIAAAFAWTYRNIKQHGGDPSTIFMSGHSAGGHLACLLALDPQFLREEHIPSGTIKGVLALSAIYNVRRMNEKSLKSMAEPEFGSDRRMWAQGSPLWYVRGGLPPFLVLNAERDTRTLREQAEEFTDAMRVSGNRVDVVELKGQGHIGEIVRSSEPLVPPMLEFLKSVVPGSRAPVASKSSPARGGVPRPVAADCSDPDMAVTFPDPELEKAVRRAMNQPTRDITVGDMRTITTLILDHGRNMEQGPDLERKISDLRGLECCENLRALFASDNEIKDLSPLSGLTQMDDLDLSDNQVSDLSPISTMVNLWSLDLSDNPLSDPSPLSGLENLTRLFLFNDEIGDIAALSGMTGLEAVDLSGNRIEDIGPLAGLSSLFYLRLNHNRIADVSALSGLAGLEVLEIRNNLIGDMNPLAGLSGVISLDLSQNRITSVPVLSDLTRLWALKLDDNRITEISGLSGHANLGFANLSDNQIADLSPLARVPMLVGIYVNGNQIVDVPDFSALSRLELLDLSWNRISDIGSLSGPEKLFVLDLTGNQVTDILPLVLNWDLRRHFELVRETLAKRSPIISPYSDEVYLRENPLNEISCGPYADRLRSRGVEVEEDCPRAGGVRERGP